MIFIYFGRIFRLLYVLLNLKSVVGLIYTVFFGHSWLLNKMQPDIILSNIFCQRRAWTTFIHLKPLFIFILGVDIIISVWDVFIWL